jgi:hypothetical protein
MGAEASPLSPLGCLDQTAVLVTYRFLICCDGSRTDAFFERMRPLAPKGEGARQGLYKGGSRWRPLASLSELLLSLLFASVFLLIA